MITFIKNIARELVFKYRRRSSESFIKYLRKKGCTIGENVYFRFPQNTIIDTLRPSFIQIGSNVDINNNFIIMAHDYQSHVFKAVYHDFVNSEGKVVIGDNVYFGTNVTILKGVTIGNNCIIGAGSVVTHSIPNNSVAAGAPCKVIATLDDFYQRRKKEALYEAFEFANSIPEMLRREPTKRDFYEDWIYFEGQDQDIIQYQMRDLTEEYLSSHKFAYPNMEAFLEAAKQYKIKKQ